MSEEKDISSLVKAAREITLQETVGTELEVKKLDALVVQSKALASIASSLGSLVESLPALLTQVGKQNISSGILQGLASNMGRGALDARLMKQNSLEITEMIGLLYQKIEERVRAEKRDPEIHDAEVAFQKAEKPVP